MLRITMLRILCGIALIAVLAPAAIAQRAAHNASEYQVLKLLNPDGSAAEDAQVVAIMSRGVRLDASLNVVGLGDPKLALDRSEHTVEVRNQAGSLVVSTAQGYPFALVAQSDQGFAFVPVSAKPTVVTLRPWAKLKIDASMAEQDRAGVRLSVVWQNSFAGSAAIPVRMPSSDPFDVDNASLNLVNVQQAPGATQAYYPNIVDWRFSKIVTWERSLDGTEQTVNVPPGEVMVVLRGGDSSATDDSIAVQEVHFKPMRTMSGRQADFVLPELGSATGTLVEDASLPDWNTAAGDSWVQAERTHSSTIPVDLLAKANSNPGAAEELFAKFYGSQAGMEFRYSRYPMAFARVRDGGEIELRHVPSGNYQLNLIAPGSLQRLKPSAQAGEGSSGAMSLQIEPGQPVELGELAPIDPANAEVQPQSDPFGSSTGVAQGQAPASGQQQAGEDPFGSPLPPEAAEERIRQVLQQMVEHEYNGTPLRQVLLTLADDFNIPIWINQSELDLIAVDADTPINLNLPAVTLQSALNIMLEPLDLTYLIRNEVLEITTESSASRTAATNRNEALPQMLGKSLIAQLQLEVMRQQSALAEADKILGQDHPERKRLAAELDRTLANVTEVEQANRTASGSEVVKSPSAELDTGQQFIKQWLAANQGAVDDRATLRAALQAHLEQEFDANLQSRESELQRLEQLLEKSREWLSSRNARRVEIIAKRIDELLNEQ